MAREYIPGTEGYASVTQKFIEATLAINFVELHKDFVPFIPKRAGYILDVGAGIGRDAFVFSEMGHTVVAVEPTEAFRIAGKELYDSTNIEWVNDSLPSLELLGSRSDGFDFILASGVWHHLDSHEQYHSMRRIAQLLKPDGVFALTLRHGPAGVGTHVFPTNGKKTAMDAEQCGLTTLLILENKPSLMKNKEQVSWTKLVLQKHPAIKTPYY